MKIWKQLKADVYKLCSYIHRYTHIDALLVSVSMRGHTQVIRQIATVNIGQLRVCSHIYTYV